MVAISTLAMLLAWGGCGDDGSDATGSLDGTTTAATDSGTGSAQSTGTQTSPLEAETNVILHAGQPMVVDVQITLSRAATVQLMHPSDDGVSISPTDSSPDGTEHGFRVRGLAPATDHALSYVARADDDGEMVDGSIPFTTGDPLPGFVYAFEIESMADTPEPLYRLFDMGGFPTFEHSGMFMVDPTGVTRWYLGETNTLMGPEAVWAGAKLRPDGTVMYLHGLAAHVRDELGEELLTIEPQQLGLPGLHHELIELRNGNFVSIGFTFRDIDYPVEGTLHVAGDVIVEFTPQGDVVWMWDSFDHLDPLRVREGFEILLFDPDTGEQAHDWTHSNGLEYDADDDSFLLSMRHQDWIIEIDHATGDVKWRLGQEGDFALTSGTWFFHPHSPQWQPDGSLVLYDNGVGNPDLPDDQETSRAVRYVLDETALEATVVWEDDAEDFTAPIAGDVDRLPGGRLQVLDSSIQGGPGQVHARIRELDPEASPMTVWAIRTPPGHFVYRATAHDALVGQANE